MLAIADQLITRAINTGARITFVKDESMLANDGGVGAILRFSMNAHSTG